MLYTSKEWDKLIEPKNTNRIMCLLILVILREKWRERHWNMQIITIKTEKHTDGVT